MANPKGQDKERINEEIPHAEVRLILDDGSQHGVVKISEARQLADGAGLDLVEIAPMAKPPVVRIMDYGKYKFEKNKKEKEDRKKQRAAQVEIKEIKFRPKIEEHDYNVKMKNIRKFLEAGDKVKVVVRFRGREMMFQHKGLELLKKVAADVEELGVVEKRPEMQGRLQIMMLVPKSS